MEDKKIILTSEGYKKLEQELAYLKGPKKMEVAEKIKAARDFGDLSENSEYDEARNEQALLESRIIELDSMIRTAKVVDSISTKSIGVGVSVTLYDYEFKEEIIYHIVGITEVDPMQNKISTDSPVGKALVGNKKGDEIEVVVPDGVSRYKVLDIKKTE